MAGQEPKSCPSASSWPLGSGTSLLAEFLMGRVSPCPLVHPSSPHSSCVLSTSPVSSTMLSLETEGQTRRHPRCTFLLRDPCLGPSSPLQETVTGTYLPSRLDSHPMRYPYCHGPGDDDCATDPLGNTIMCAGRVLVCWGRVGGSSHCSGSWTVEGGSIM